MDFPLIVSNNYKATSLDMTGSQNCYGVTLDKILA